MAPINTTYMISSWAPGNSFAPVSIAAVAAGEPSYPRITRTQRTPQAVVQAGPRPPDLSPPALLHRADRPGGRGAGGQPYGKEVCAMTVSPVRLNHAVLFVADLDRAARFYLEVFGMHLVAREDRFNAVFLRLPRSGNHHDLGLFGVGPDAAPKRRGGIGLYHLAWQVDTIDELVQFRERLIESGAYTAESSHGATKSIYGADPDGNEFEIMWMLPQEHWGVHADAGSVERLDLPAEVARWSRVQTAGRIVQNATGQVTA